ncbi:hypothetical protein ACLKA6_017731 [Drosophila palustris]
MSASILSSVPGPSSAERSSCEGDPSSFALTNPSLEALTSLGGVSTAQMAAFLHLLDTHPLPGIGFWLAYEHDVWTPFPHGLQQWDCAASQWLRFSWVHLMLTALRARS